MEERIEQNESNQTLDLNKWAFSRIESYDSEIEILEFCCGTGRQTKKLAGHFPNARITALDISPDAIKSIQENDFFDVNRMSAVVSGMDEFLESSSKKFDIVFVSYGLYYSKDVNLVIKQVISCLNPGGKFIVLGSYGNNNKDLFDLVRFSGVEIDHFVTYSCTDFMYDKVIRLSLSYFESFSIETSVNIVNWKSVEDVISYWKNTTFYESGREADFRKNIEQYFSSSTSFSIEKHIMLFQGLNKL